MGTEKTKAKPPRTPERVTLFNDDIDWMIKALEFLVDDTGKVENPADEFSTERLRRLHTRLLANRPR